MLLNSKIFFACVAHSKLPTWCNATMINSCSYYTVLSNIFAIWTNDVIVTWPHNVHTLHHVLACLRAHYAWHCIDKKSRSSAKFKLKLSKWLVPANLVIQAYGEVLRLRMVWQREALGHTYDQIASNLTVDISTVQRTVQLFLNSGSVCKRPYHKERAFRKLTLPAEHFVLHLVVDNPAIYLDEVSKPVLMLEVSVSTICRFLHGNGFTQRSCKKWLYSKINSWGNSTFQMYLYIRGIC